MNIIIPMAGKGARFSKSGFTLPKPLIKVANKKMYQHAVDCLPLKEATKIIFVIRQDEFSCSLIAHIKENYFNTYNCCVVLINGETQGQAETILRAADVLDYAQPTLIHNCDTFVSFSWPKSNLNKCDGAVVLFHSNENRWSYAKLNEAGNKIVDMQEKKVISPYASSGTYFFKDTSYLIKNIEKIIQEDRRENNEYYLSTIYSLMIESNKNIIPLWSDHLLCFGTPQDLVNSLNYMLKTKKVGS